MLILTFLIPIIFAVFILIFFNKKAVLWEYLILIIPSLIISSLLYFGMITSSESDTEYLGEYVTGVKYYEPWDEYIHRTCTRTVGSGKHSHTVTYDCSYVERHPAEYVQTLSSGYEYGINKNEYERLIKEWSTPVYFIDMNRNFYSRDGDCYVKKWDGNKEKCKTVTFESSYKNKIKVSHSIFGFTKITPEEAKTEGLFDYPKLYSQGSSTNFFSDNDTNQTPILGKAPTSKELQLWQYINGYYGNTKQFRAYILFFKNKPHSIVEKQKSYWEGGNKNEFVMCFGIDSDNNIKWVDAFSWSDKKDLEVYFRDFYVQKNKVNLTELGEWIKPNISRYWVRKNFSDFDYVTVELSGSQITWLFVIVFMFNMIMSIIIINNDAKYE